MRKWIAFMLVLFLAVVAIGCGEKTPEHVHKFVDGICECGEKEPTTDVEVKPTEIKVSGEKAEIEVGEEFDLTIEVLPADAKNKNVRVVANPSGIVEIKNNKTIKGLKGGEVTITVSAVAAPTVKKEIKLTVKGEEVVPEVINPESFTLGGKTEVELGKTTALSITALPEGAKKDATWTSSDETIATVNNGIVKGIALGKVTITATSTLVPTVSASYEITVIEAAGPVVVKPTSIQVSVEDEVEVGYTIRAVATVLPDGANSEVRWESMKPEVATIDDKGIIKGVSEGTTYITAYSLVDETVKSSRVKVKVVVDQSSLIPVNDMQGYVITIMNADSALGDIDPFREDYAGSDKMYKQQAWNEAQKKFNCKFEVVPYPQDAPWGPSRVTWINSQAELGKALSDFFVISTDWIPEFYASGAMHATTQYFAKFGKNQMEPAVKQSATYKGNLYAVSTGISLNSTYADTGLYYNVGMLEKYKIESPAKLFNEDRWNYDQFLEWVLSAQALLPEGYFVLSGSAEIYWTGMSNASGVKLANTATLELNFLHQYSQDAVDVLRQAVLGGAMDTAGGYDQSVESFQSGKALIQTASLWFVKADNRFPADLWGEDTRYGYVPFPYHPNLSKERTFVNLTGASVQMMAGQREYNHPAGVTYEDVFRATQEMYLNTIKYQQQDPTYDAEGLKEKAISSKLDDPESVEAFLFYTAEKTLFDPIYAGIEVDWSSKLSTAVKNSVYKGDDFIQGIESVTNEVLMKMISIYG